MTKGLTVVGAALALGTACSAAGADTHTDGEALGVTPAEHTPDTPPEAPAPSPSNTNSATSSDGVDDTSSEVTTSDAPNGVTPPAETAGVPISTLVVPPSGQTPPPVGTGEPEDSTSAPEVNDTQAPPAECTGDVCECDAGYGWYPEVDATRCLQLCDTTGLLPFDSDADVAALAAQGCEALAEGLTASGPGVTSFAGLETIRFIASDVVIQDTTLSTLAGLSGLEAFGGTFVLINNTELTELGWHKLKQAGSGGIVVLSNPKLTTLNGFDGAEFPKVSLTVVDNDSLINLDGFRTLSNVATIAVAQNDALVDTDAFGALFSVETLTITENTKLVSAMVGALNDVGTFTVADNPLLESVFARCLVSAQTVSIQNNAALHELIMPAIAGAAFSIADNPALPQCKVDMVSGGSCSNCTGNDETATCDQP